MVIVMSRIHIQSALVTTVFVSFVVAGCSNDNFPGTAELSSSRVSSEMEQAAIFCPDCQVVNVTRVIDGDTIDTSIGRVRFYGVDTPERGEECFDEATAVTKRLAGSEVRLEKGPRLTDSFDRHLSYVYDITGNSIDEQLVKGGFALAWTRDGQHRDALVEMQRIARDVEAGCLWGG